MCLEPIVSLAAGSGKRHLECGTFRRRFRHGRKTRIDDSGRWFGVAQLGGARFGAARLGARAFRDRWCRETGACKAAPPAPHSKK
ncbi:MAG: hypothetical protein RLY70_4662 [Planctomycetota bacterium]|jgi:hypothetical protein